MSERDDDHRDPLAGGGGIDDPDGPYVKQTIQLTASHRWRAAPGCNILVIDAGAMRMEYPHGWHVIPKSGRLQVHDRRPPDDEGRFQITVFRLPPLAGRSWEDLPLDRLLRGAIEGGAKRRRRAKREVLRDVTQVRRPDLEYVWTESRAPDPENGRPILTRQVLARARGVQPLITFDYYASRAADYEPVWQHAMDSLRLGAPVTLLGDASN